MIATRTTTEGAPEVLTIGEPRLTAGLGELARIDYQRHREIHGDLPRLSVDDVITLAGLANLRGKGGAGFPFARKIKAVVEAANQRQAPITVVVNATEGEPAAAKDKMLLARTPHLILDGAELVARVLGAREIIIAVAHGGPGERSILEAISEREGALRTRVVRMPDRFISGESGSIIQGINGNAPIPPGRKSLAAERGVNGMPTMFSNAETFSQLAMIATLGADLYSMVGDPKEPGTVLLTVTGSAQRAAVVEAPSGTPLRQVLELCEANVGRGILTGGYHGKWLQPSRVDEAICSRDGMEKVGAVLGAGILVPIGPDTCPLGESSRILHYMGRESAGQCAPCFRGLPDLAQTFDDMMRGKVDPEAVRRAAAGVVKKGACAHPDGTARFAQSAVEAFADEIRVHASRGSCSAPTKGILPLPRAATDDGQLMLDWARCEGHGLCARLAPGLIQLDQNGFPTDRQFAVPDRLEMEARLAVDMCPALALRLQQRAER